MIQPDELQSLRDTLQRAIFSGTRVAKYGDREVEYASIADMRSALADLNSQIAIAANKVTSSSTLAMHSRD